jgi:hypothetical protein
VGNVKILNWLNRYLQESLLPFPAIILIDNVSNNGLKIRDLGKICYLINSDNIQHNKINQKINKSFYKNSMQDNNDVSVKA